MPQLIPFASDHWGERLGNRIEFYIFHGIDAQPGTTLEGAAKYLKRNDRGVSAHELVGGTTTYLMVPDEKVAWHCGGSRLPNGSEGRLANRQTWGIEGYQITGKPMDPATRRTMLERIAAAMFRNGHGPADVWRVAKGHREVDLHGKTCPGPGFDLEEFRRELVDYMAPLQTALPAVNYGKVVWAIEMGARVLKGEGFVNEHNYIVQGILPELIRLRG